MIHPFMLSWPAEEVHTDNGQPIEDTVAMQLPLDKAEWAAAMKSIVTRTKPYALLLCEQREHEVVVIFESQHGTKSWHFPILKLGNRFLGYRTEKEDTESIGILWRSTKALA